MNHGGIEHRSASNSLEGTLEKRKKEIIRGTDPFFLINLKLVKESQ